MTDVASQRPASGERGPVLTNRQGHPVHDNQNQRTVGARGPATLENYQFLEKISHFDRERIPERVVHARGSGAHGYFEPYRSWSDLSRAAFLQDPAKRTPVFARFSTVAGGAGSGDLHRDVRGFAVKFYTEEGNFDLVGNNMPVASKYPNAVAPRACTTRSGMRSRSKWLIFSMKW